MLYNAGTMFEETKVPDPGSTGWYPLRKTSHNTLVFYMYQLYTVFFLFLSPCLMASQVFSPTTILFDFSKIIEIES